MAKPKIRNRKSDRAAPARAAAHQIFVVSDATGRTAEMVVRAAVVQFQGAEVHLTVRPHVRSVEAVRAAVRAASRARGLIVHTLVSPELRNVILTEGRAQEVPT